MCKVKRSLFGPDELASKSRGEIEVEPACQWAIGSVLIWDSAIVLVCVVVILHPQLRYTQQNALAFICILHDRHYATNINTKHSFYVAHCLVHNQRIILVYSVRTPTD